MSRRLVNLATCTLSQWALDFEGNAQRILKSIQIAKEKGATLRTGPELEITGYGCLDHFLEMDVYTHSLEMLHSILSDEATHGILLDIGLPIMFKGLRLNCRVLSLDGRIILIRPKMWLAQDGNYREMRYFTPWQTDEIDEFRLPEIFHELQGSKTCPIGNAIVSTNDSSIGLETCQELFEPMAPHNLLTLNGAEIITNSSGSHFSLRKLDVRVGLIQQATKVCGGIYLYSNQIGCDGDRLYYDGCSMILCNGQIVGQGSQFALCDMEVIISTVDLDEVRAYRSSPSRGLQAVAAPKMPNIYVDFNLSSPGDDLDPSIFPSPALSLKMHSPEEQIALAPAAYMWSMLRRSRQAGFLLPLSGGLDSASTATLVYSMCRLIMAAIEEGQEQVIADVKRISGPYHEENWMPKDARDLCGSILSTVYLGMEKQSSAETRSRSQRLAESIGSYHLSMDIDGIFSAQKDLLAKATGFEPNFKVHGGTLAENLGLQNIQSRSRMVTSYYCAQLLPTIRKRAGAGSLLVLASGNVDECLRGYLTKYDCSSADLNPIGSISKTDLKRFLAYAQTEFSLPILKEFLDATPTAELEPLTEDYVQSDEQDMGMTYAELSVFGRLRKEAKLGPYGMWQRLVHDWRDKCTPRETATKVKHFFHCYAINRHKMTTITPALHMEDYSVDDNRYDMRPWVYPNSYESWSFKQIDRAVEKMEKKQAEKANESAQRA